MERINMPKSKCCNAEIITSWKTYDISEMQYYNCSNCGNPLYSTGELTPTANTAKKPDPTPPTNPQNFFELPEKRQREIMEKAKEDSIAMQEVMTSRQPSKSRLDTPPTSTVELRQWLTDRIDYLEDDLSDEYENPGNELDGIHRIKDTFVDEVIEHHTRLIQQAELRGELKALKKVEDIFDRENAYEWIMDAIENIEAKLTQLKGGKE